MGNNVNKKVESFLMEFGLTQEEVILYLTLLESGPSTVMDISKKTKIKRSTTHNYIQGLIEKGIVSQTNYGGRRQVVAEMPEKLKILLDQKTFELKKMESTLPEIVTILNSTVSDKTKSKVEMKYYEGKNGFREVCQRSLDYSQDEIMFISNLEEWHRVYSIEYDTNHYIPIRLSKNVKLKMLITESDMIKKMRIEDESLNRETRLLPKGFNFSSTTIIYNGEVSFMISSEPYTAIVISNNEIYQMFYSIFSDLWQRGQ